ncbi:APC family permease [Phytoactinopolyspora limicola]|uniref:APC family permease n=1 Tax=Phytoactinopolyspora limicola TaxID=2715536 RepID=UPI00140D952F|nr:APC family permease [Phytoactinopolyspora limicola]
MPDHSSTAGDGQPPHLRRRLPTIGTILITLSAITPASSVFIIAPGVIGQAGTGAFYSFVGAGVVGIFMAFVYAELSSAYPLTGGEYAIVGRTLGRLPGFMILGLLLVIQVFIIAVIALGVGVYLGVLFDGLNVAIVGAITALACAGIGMLGIRFNAAVTGAFLVIEMIALVVLAALGIVRIERPITELLTNPVVLDAGGMLVPASAGLITGATAVAIFAYNGYGSAVYMGEETRDASRGIARAILWALGITVTFELIPVTAVMLGAPSLEDLLGAGNMMEYFLLERGGETLNTIMSLAVALAIINAVLAIMLFAARLLYSTGRDHAWPRPVSDALARIHPKYRSPWVATLVVGVVAAAVCFMDETLLLVATGTGLVVIYGSLCLAALVGRRNGSTAHGAYKMPWFPLPPLIGIGALLYVIYESARDPEIGRPSLFVSLGVLTVSALYYLLVIRRRRQWVLRGAADEDDVVAVPSATDATSTTDVPEPPREPV